MASPQGDKSQRTVSVYGPIFIGNNCLKLPVDQGDGKTTTAIDDDEPRRKSIDVSKYRIPTPKIAHRLLPPSDRSSPDPCSTFRHNAGRREHDNTQWNLKSYSENDSSTGTQNRHDMEWDANPYSELNIPAADVEHASRDSRAADELDTTSRDSAIEVNDDANIEHGQHTDGPRLTRYRELGKFSAHASSVTDDLTDRAGFMDYNAYPSPRQLCGTPFKISSTEDNYVLNKYKTRACNATHNDTGDIKGNSKPAKVRDKQIKPNRSKASLQNTSTGKEYFSKHRLKIAKLKRRFFEALPGRDASNGSKSSRESRNQSMNGDTTDDANTSETTNTRDDADPLPDFDHQEMDPGSKPSNGYATESKATMMRKLGARPKDPYRRYSSEGILGDRSVFSASQWAPERSSRGDNTDYVAVVAIDFGTTYSGYAYSFCHEPEPVHLMRRQEGGDPGVFDQKVPTCLLLTPEGRFQAFGYAAREFYHDLEPKHAPKWMFFDRFKMLLHNDQSLTKDSKLRSVSGREFSAMKVFSYSLAYFRDLVLQELTDQSAISVSCDVIRWVITVPAIWKASAKQFMRHAAYEAGIVPKERPDQLLIALEPEAASIYCRRLRMLHLTTDETKTSTSNLTTRSSLSLPDLQNESLNIKSDDLDIGTQYMVVDCGGGTVDITVHELMDGGRLKELHRASGGSHGSVGIDEEFENLLEAIFGADIIDQFKRRRPAGWVDLLAVFESRKRTASPYRTSDISVSLPFSFIDFYKKCRGSSVEVAVRKYSDPDIAWSSTGQLRLSPGTMRRLFLGTIDGIKRAIGEVLNNADLHDLSYLFLVGGFAESSMVQHEIRKDFGSLLKVVIPPAVSMSILKGAVYFGLDPYVVEERCSCMTYGVGVLHRYDVNKHPVTKLVSKDGIDWCTDIFDAFVTANQSIALGDCIVRRYTPVRRDQSVTIIHVYSTDRDDVRYVTDAGVTRCGTLTLKLDDSVAGATSPGGGRREIRTEMMFGDTEIKIRATDVRSQLCVEASIDFMNV